MGQTLDWVRAPYVGVKAFCPDANGDEPVGWEAPSCRGKVYIGGCRIWVTQSGSKTIVRLGEGTGPSWKLGHTGNKEHKGMSMFRLLGTLLS